MCSCAAPLLLPPAAQAVAVSEVVRKVLGYAVVRPAREVGGGGMRGWHEVRSSEGGCVPLLQRHTYIDGVDCDQARTRVGLNGAEVRELQV